MLLERTPLAPRELVDRARDGDEVALGQLIGRCQGAISRFVAAQLGPRDDCGDICQIVFVKMMRALPRLKSAEVFEAWLFQLARNACVDASRSARRRDSHFVPLGAEHLDLATANDAAGSTPLEPLHHALAQLAEGQRKLLELSLDTPRSYVELSRMTGLSVAAVRNRLFRARERLRSLVGAAALLVLMGVGLRLWRRLPEPAALGEHEQSHLSGVATQTTEETTGVASSFSLMGERGSVTE
jgi:RNA polymerase sigma-70 factor (ECF subfamily)